ncbi:MAG: hypothetical protein U0821_08345 [Chloroflexota bacterium]
MKTRLLRFALVISVLALVDGARAAPTFAQQGTPCDASSSRMQPDMGTPSAEGVTTEARIDDPSVRLGYPFRVSKPGAAFVYVGDQWYDLDLAVYSRGNCAVVAQWEVLARGASSQSGRRVIQLVRPDEQILMSLPPGDYLLVVGHKYARDPQFASDFDPAKGFTIRVALAAPVCGLEPANSVESQIYPGVFQRPQDAIYQLGLTIDPPPPPLSPEPAGQFTLLTFSAVISPPYVDLFDFQWQIDGRPVGGATDPVFQVPAASIPRTPDGMHKVRVTALGARDYPDPDTPPQSRRPPTLSLECSFRVR